MVVLGLKVREGGGKARQVRRQPPPPQPFAEGAMEALDFALRLRMTHPAMQESNALIQQKDAQRRQARRIRRRPPRGAVIHQHRRRYAVAFEAVHQRGPDARFMERRQRIEADRIATVVVHDA
jgi:hypothetical protein